MKITMTCVRPMGFVPSIEWINSSDAPDVRSMSMKQLSHNEIYAEYREIWEKDDGDELSKTKRCIAKIATGRQLRYIDTVTPEALEGFGMSLDDPPIGVVYMIEPSSFLVHRFCLRSV